MSEYSNEQDVIQFRERNIDCISRLYNAILNESWDRRPLVKFSDFVYLLSKLIVTRAEKPSYPKPIIYHDWLDVEADTQLTGEEEDDDEVHGPD